MCHALESTLHVQESSHLVYNRWWFGLCSGSASAPSTVHKTSARQRQVEHQIGRSRLQPPFALAGISRSPINLKCFKIDHCRLSLCSCPRYQKARVPPPLAVCNSVSKYFLMRMVELYPGMLLYCQMRCQYIEIKFHRPIPKMLFFKCKVSF